jgi:hypothetical protein
VPRSFALLPVRTDNKGGGAHARSKHRADDRDGKRASGRKVALGESDIILAAIGDADDLDAFLAKLREESGE